MSGNRFRRARVAGVFTGTLLLLSPPAGAAPGQEADPGSERQEGSASSAQVRIDIDVQTADATSLEGAVEDIRENVAAQLAELNTARQKVIDAEAELQSKTAAVTKTQEEIDGLVVLSDEVVTRAYVMPPSSRAIDLLSTESVMDAALKRSLLDLLASEDADVLTTLAEKREELEERKAEEDAALAKADAAKQDAIAALEELQAAASQQAAFAIDVEQRIEQGLTELETLETIDPALAEELRKEQAEMADLIEKVKVDAETQATLADAGVPPPDDDFVDGGSQIEPVGGGVVSVTCSSGGNIQIAGDISRDVQSLLNLADQQGIPLCGAGWRDPQDQIRLRRQNCGTSDYAIYQAPSSACSPPTARPGTSMHEKGLAIDFTCGRGAVRSGDTCFNFLSSNAASYGLYNLPSEPWHWSTNGL